MTLRLYAAVLAILTIAGATLRFQGLGVRDFWYDESCTFIYVHRLFDWPDWNNLVVESTNLPYYALLRAWTALFGHTEAAYRAFSALAATLTVPVLALAAMRLAGVMPGLITGAIAAFQPLQVFYAHEARAYALWALVLAVLWLLLIEALRSRRAMWWAAYGAVLLFCLTLHYFSVFWIPASAACLLWPRDRSVAVRRWLLTNVVVLMLFAPFFAWAVWPAASAGGSAWIADQWRPAAAIAETLWAFLPAGGYPEHLRGLSLRSVDTVTPGPRWLHQAAAILPVVLALVITWAFCRRRRDVQKAGHAAHPTTAILIIAAALPLVLAFLYSVLVRPVYLPGRYDLVAWPALTILIAVMIKGASHRLAPQRPAFAATVLTLFFVACAIPPLVRMAALQPPPTFHRLRAARVAELVHPEDIVITLSYDREYLEYYLFRTGSDAQIESFPPWLDHQVGWVDTPADLTRMDEVAEAAALWPARVLMLTQRGGRAMLLADSMDPNGTGPRGPINRTLIHTLRSAGLSVVLLDETFFILEVQVP